MNIDKIVPDNCFVQSACFCHFHKREIKHFVYVYNDNGTGVTLNKNKKIFDTSMSTDGNFPVPTA